LGLTHGVPENGPGTYVSYNSDAALAHDKLGMNTFRMSIEWSRIFPKSTASVDLSNEGGTVSLADLKALDALANQDEVKHYRDVFAPTTPALERTPKPASIKAISDITFGNALPLALLGMYIPSAV
jgi:hypothetical protein